jgi:hypothetical protein
MGWASSSPESVHCSAAEDVADRAFMALRNGSKYFTFRPLNSSRSKSGKSLIGASKPIPLLASASLSAPVMPAIIVFHSPTSCANVAGLYSPLCRR